MAFRFRRRNPARACAPAIVLVAAIFAAVAAATACPFCTRLAPSLSQRREQAAVVALVEQGVHVHRVFKSPDAMPLTAITMPLVARLPRQGLVLAFGTSVAADAAANPSESAAGKYEFKWDLLPVQEIQLAYFARRRSCALRPTNVWPISRPTWNIPIRCWPTTLTLNLAMPATMKWPRWPIGCRWIGCANGWSIRRFPRSARHSTAWRWAWREPAEREQNRRLLEKLITTDAEAARPGGDFRAGFDGLLGGYLMLSGSEGLELLERHYFNNPRAAEGDLRHVVTALRFYHEYGRDIPDQRQARALLYLLARPEMAADAILDLARLGDWDSLADVAALYDRPGYEAAATRRVIVGYLLACPRPQAAAELERLSKIDPAGVKAAEQTLRDLPAGIRGGAAK